MTVLPALAFLPSLVTPEGTLSRSRSGRARSLRRALRRGGGPQPGTAGYRAVRSGARGHRGRGGGHWRARTRPSSGMRPGRAGLRGGPRSSSPARRSVSTCRASARRPCASWPRVRLPAGRGGRKSLFFDREELWPVADAAGIAGHRFRPGGPGWRRHGPIGPRPTERRSASMQARCPHPARCSGVLLFLAVLGGGGLYLLSRHWAPRPSNTSFPRPWKGSSA
jgi:hypothetical protein